MLKKKISKEYAEFDLLKLFGPLPTLYRALFVNKKSTIQNPGFLIGFMLDKKMVFEEILDNINAFKKIIDYAREKGSWAMTRGFRNFSFCPNMYYDLFITPEKTLGQNPNKIKEDIENFKVLVRGIKVNYCKKCPEYTLSTSQLSDIKKFRPDKAQKEIKSAVELSKNYGRETENLVKQFAQWWLTEVIEYIADNTDSY